MGSEQVVNAVVDDREHLLNGSKVSQMGSKQVTNTVANGREHLLNGSKL